MRLISMSTDVSTATTPPPQPAAQLSAIDTSTLPDDTALLKQMIADLMRALRSERRDREAVQARLDALLRRLHQPRPGPIDPDQLLLFPQIEEVPQLPPAQPGTEGPKRRGRTNKPHGRRQPAGTLRREPRRYELTPAE